MKNQEVFSYVYNEGPVGAIQPRFGRVHSNQALYVHCFSCYRICALSAIDRS